MANSQKNLEQTLAFAIAISEVYNGLAEKGLVEKSAIPALVAVVPGIIEKAMEAFNSGKTEEGPAPITPPKPRRMIKNLDVDKIEETTADLDRLTEQLEKLAKERGIFGPEEMNQLVGFLGIAAKIVLALGLI